MTPNTLRMHATIGRAVLMAQVFEAVFVVCIELVLSMREFDIGKSSEPINPNRFKVPTATKALLKELAARNDIDSEFESQIKNLVVNRHTLIHRWYLENGLPGDDDEEDISKLTNLAIEVESECKRIIALLSKYVLKWLTDENRDSSFAERLNKANLIFHDAHKMTDQNTW
jgi:hypothetical protein